MFKAANYYYATYGNVAGLQISAPVTLNGFKVGLVREINYEYNNPGHVKVELSLDRALKIPTGSKAVIEQDILGTSTVVLHLSSASTFQEVGSDIEGATASGLLDNVSQSLMPNISAIFPKICRFRTGSMGISSKTYFSFRSRFPTVTCSIKLPFPFFSLFPCSPPDHPKTL